jgi:hypothetical protein
MDLEDKKQNKRSAGSTFRSSGLATSNTNNNHELLLSVWLYVNLNTEAGITLQ